MKVYTYYQDIGFKGQDLIIEQWKKNWKKDGYEPVVLGPNDATDCSYSKSFLEKIDIAFLKILGKPMSKYTASRWMRWLAYASVSEKKHFYASEYDIFVKNFDLEINEEFHMLSGFSPCLCSGTAEQFMNMCKMVIDLLLTKAEKFSELIQEMNMFLFHDQDFFQASNLLISDKTFNHEINSFKSKYSDFEWTMSNGILRNSIDDSPDGAFHVSTNLCYQQKELNEDFGDMDITDLKLKLIKEKFK